MEQKLLLELNNHYVYYVKTEVINYYINIPKVPTTTSISVELKSKMENYNLETNDEIWVMENIRNNYQFIDQYNITLVLPILNDECISILEKIDNQRFEIIDNILAYVINHAYMDLKTRNMEINSEIVMINNDRYKSFISWFTTKYSNRITLKKLLNLIQEYNTNATPYKKIDTPAISFVIGSYTDEVNAPKIIRQVEPNPNANLQNQKNQGFTSYWLLAVITLAVSIAIIFAVFVYK